MSQVLQIAKELSLLIGLFYFAWNDYQTKLIKVKLLVELGLVGIVLQIISFLGLNLDSKVLWNIVWGVVVGGVLLGISF